MLGGLRLHVGQGSDVWRAEVACMAKEAMLGGLRFPLETAQAV